MARWILYYDSERMDDAVGGMLTLARDTPFIEIVGTVDMDEEKGWRIL